MEKKMAQSSLKKRNQLLWPTDMSLDGSSVCASSSSYSLSSVTQKPSPHLPVAEHPTFEVDQDELAPKIHHPPPSKNVSYALKDTISFDSRASAMLNLSLGLAHVLMMVIATVLIYGFNHQGLVFGTFSYLSMHLNAVEMIVVPVRFDSGDIDGGMIIISMCALSILYFLLAGFSSLAYYKISSTPRADSWKFNAFWMSAFRYLYFHHVKSGIFFHSFFFIGVLVSLAASLNSAGTGLADDIDIAGASICTMMGFVGLSLLQAVFRLRTVMAKKHPYRAYFLVALSICGILLPCGMALQMIITLTERNGSHLNFAFLWFMLLVNTSVSIGSIILMLITMFVHLEWSRVEITNAAFITFINLLYAAAYITGFSFSKFSDQHIGLDNWIEASTPI